MGWNGCGSIFCIDAEAGGDCATCASCVFCAADRWMQRLLKIILAFFDLACVNAAGLIYRHTSEVVSKGCSLTTILSDVVNPEFLVSPSDWPVVCGSFLSF